VFVQCKFETLPGYFTYTYRLSYKQRNKSNSFLPTLDIRSKPYNLPFACLCLAPLHMHTYKWMLLKYRKFRKTYRTLYGVNCHDDANCSRTTDFLSYCNGLLKILQRLGLQICSVARQRAKKFSASRGLRTPDLIHYTLAMCPKTAHDPPFPAIWRRCNMLF